MAEVDFDDFEDAVYAPRRESAGTQHFGQLLNYAGAASSIALVLLLAVWGYKLAMRDVNGVPVMRALEGPMRSAPADPGGQMATNQGLSVNAVASTGVASPVADKVVLAPAATALTEDDAAGLAGPVAGGAVPAVALPLAVAEVLPDAPPKDADAAALAVTDAVTDAVAAAVADDAASTDTGDGIARSLVPQPRPSKAAMTSKAYAAVVEVDPAAIPLGTRLAQIGAFDTPEQARENWLVLAGKYAEVMDGKSMVVQQAVSGGKTFYRLRAMGFATDDDTRRFCAVFDASSADCTPVAQR